jgi:hypothetical protein
MQLDLTYRGRGEKHELFDFVHEALADLKDQLDSQAGQLILDLVVLFTWLDDANISVYVFRAELKRLAYGQDLTDELGLLAFYTKSEAWLWLATPHRLLGGDTPLQRIMSGRREDVIALVEQLKDGAFV